VLRRRGHQLRRRQCSLFGGCGRFQRGQQARPRRRQSQQQQRERAAERVLVNPWRTALGPVLRALRGCYCTRRRRSQDGTTDSRSQRRRLHGVWLSNANAVATASPQRASTRRAFVPPRLERLRRYQTTPASIEGKGGELLAARCTLHSIALGSLLPWVLCA